jgi:hypothetical protein
MVQTVATWNQITAWLGEVDRLRRGGAPGAFGPSLARGKHAEFRELARRVS